MKKIWIINGPNLNMLGIREKSVYGSKTLEQMNAYLLECTRELDVSLEFFQSNHEGALIDRIHQAYQAIDGMVLNAGAYTHYSYAIRDAIAAVQVPCVEVHLSDIHKREAFRAVSVIREVCIAQICGLGEEGYVQAVRLLTEA